MKQTLTLKILTLLTVFLVFVIIDRFKGYHRLDLKLMVHVKEKVDVSFHSERPWFMRMHVIYIFVLNKILFLTYWWDKSESGIYGTVASWIWFPVLIVAALLSYLCTHWSLKFNLWANYYTFPGIVGASHVCVIPAAIVGAPQICKLKKEKWGEEKVLTFVFQKVKYVHSGTLPTDNADIAISVHVVDGKATEGYFAPVAFPVADSLSFYRNSQGISTPEQVEKSNKKFGKNVFDIPVPSFAELFSEHAKAPFFVFQIFCVGLWLLDEYWYYAMITLLMLIAFEATVVKKRQRQLQDLREMRIAPHTVQVLRHGDWLLISSNDLVPGDLCSVVRADMKNDVVVPCDLLLLRGSCVMNEALLTGESVPQLKENILSYSDTSEALDIKGKHKNCVIYGGTRVLLHDNGASRGASNSPITVKQSPDGGALAYVIRTGYNSSQGRLVRTILYSTGRMSVNTSEALWFIGFLLIFAVVAAAYVLFHGLNDPKRDKYKLILNCIMIVTSVVPPELPMELSLAVNTSLIALQKVFIFCTEPFRIPFAGGINVCCFDKTGTLTSDKFNVLGVVGLDKADLYAIQPSIGLPGYVKHIIAGCHSLVYIQGEGIVGDPMEMASFASIGYSYSAHGNGAVSPDNATRIKIEHRFPFSSHLKRMAAIALLETKHGSTVSSQYIAICKGAAETMLDRFKKDSVPTNYNELHQHYAREGCRIIALGYKSLGDATAEMRMQIEADVHSSSTGSKKFGRDSIESDLIYAGFLVMRVPLKPDSKSIISELISSSHKIVMITGDHILTACHVAKSLNILVKPALVLSLVPSGRRNSFVSPKDDAKTEREHFPDDNDKNSASSNASSHKCEWASVDEKLHFPLDILQLEQSLKSLSKTYDLCVSGVALSYLAEEVKVNISVLEAIVPFVYVFARTTPDQKEFILNALKRKGNITLMCGDGTNDVGALKQAHCGIALTGDEDVVSPTGRRWDKIKKQNEEDEKEEDAPENKLSTLTNRNKSSEVARKVKDKKIRSARQAKEAEERQKARLADDMEEAASVRLGDASIASPFTSKLPYITAVKNVILQGRCTLVTTMQMYTILALNCLVSAYSMSVLYLDGLKLGEVQMTFAGLSVAMFFLFISRSKPLNSLSPERPSSNIFTVHMFATVLGQFCMHMYVLMTAVHWSQEHTSLEDRGELEADFKPNVLNSVVYLVSTSMTVSTFLANYKGKPFMQSLMENKFLFRALCITEGLIILLAMDILRPLNELFELHPLPSEDFALALVQLILLDLIGTVVWAKLMAKIFALSPSGESKDRIKLVEAC